MTYAKISDFLNWLSPHAGSSKGAEQWQYLLGTSGQILTDKLLLSKAKANYGDEWAAVVAAMQKHRGKLVMDCNGVAEFYLRLALGGNHDTKSRYNYSDWCKGYNGTDMSQLPQIPGCAVFQAYSNGTVHHVGFLWKKYGPGVKDWYVIEAAGHKVGVILTKLANTKAWNRWGLMMAKFVYDVPGEAEVVPPVLDPKTMPWLSLGRKGMTKDSITQLQRLLQKHGFGAKFIESLIGQYGGNTDKAVRAFQKANGLEVDGVVGPLTWAKLLI